MNARDILAGFWDNFAKMMKKFDKIEISPF